MWQEGVDEGVEFRPQELLQGVHLGRLRESLDLHDWKVSTQPPYGLSGRYDLLFLTPFLVAGLGRLRWQQEKLITQWRRWEKKKLQAGMVLAAFSLWRPSIAKATQTPCASHVS
jgi:hypothetical protein